MQKFCFKKLFYYFSLAFVLAVFFPAPAFSKTTPKVAPKTSKKSPKKVNNLIFQSKPSQHNVTIQMVVSVPQFKNKKMIGNWIPRRIIVYQGQRIHLIIESLDVEHIFVLPAYKIKLPLIPGKKEHFSFTANKTGMFYFHCGNRECAPLYLHRLMVGQFIVKDEPDSKK